MLEKAICSLVASVSWGTRMAVCSLALEEQDRAAYDCLVVARVPGSSSLLLRGVLVAAELVGLKSSSTSENREDCLA